ncbi:Putative resistance protein [Enterobacter asburiae]|uniref:Resistance protein n=1 Tax=Enterobacter asburiae TaxID=61645 RepID=A0A376FIG9_ENTAS|nr:Putative resistance protein [Enterobacter asburiae]
MRATAANAVTVISIANLSGRLVLGILSDKIARIRVITIGQVVSLVGMAALLFAPLNEATFFAAIACVAFNFRRHHYRLPVTGERVLWPEQSGEKPTALSIWGFGIGSICGSLIASLFGGFYVTFLRHICPADYLAGALDPRFASRSAKYSKKRTA